MDPLTFGLALLQFVPQAVKWFTGSDKDAEIAGKVVDVAKVITGKSAPDDVIGALKADPVLVLQLQEKVLENETELERIAQSAATSVNQTMVAEAASEHWPTYSWRPAIGFAVAINVFGSVAVVFLAYGAAVFAGNTKGLEYLPGILAALAGIIGVVSPILGIASWFRGKQQVETSKLTNIRG